MEIAGVDSRGTGGIDFVSLGRNSFVGPYKSRWTVKSGLFIAEGPAKEFRARAILRWNSEMVSRIEARDCERRRIED